MFIENKEMTEKLDNRDPAICDQIYSLFQRSYTIEAELLGMDEFPPLKRMANDFQVSESDFYGSLEQGQLIALIEVEKQDENIHIASMLVHPDFFRQGLAQNLLEYVQANRALSKLTVDTAEKNEAACSLYRKMGFQEIKKWEVEPGISIIRFEKRT